MIVHTTALADSWAQPREHTDLGVVPKRVSARIICVVSAAHDVPQVGILCGSATAESCLCLGPQHQILVGRHAGCWVTRPNPTNIANANPNPPTPADRVVPVHSWRLVIELCGLISCASLVRFCLNARSSSSRLANPTQPDQYC